MVSLFSYWTIAGIFYLSYLTYQDLTKQMMVDDRKNYFMMGLTVSLLTIVRNSIIYVGVVVLLTILLSLVIRRFKLLGRADASTIQWAFFGFAMIGIPELAGWALWLSIGSILHTLIYRFVIKARGPAPFYPVLLVAFVLNVLVFKIF